MVSVRIMESRIDNVFPLRRPPARVPTEHGPAAPPAPEPLWREMLGDQLRSERQGRGERIADVAGRAGVAPQYLSELERGRKDPSSEVLSAVSGALGLSVAQLTGRVGQRLARVTATRGGMRGPVCLAA